MNIAFVDCETTHLDAEIGEAWEVAVILREQDGDETTDTEYLWQFSIDPETVDPEALRIGRWHERRQLPARTDQAAFTGSIPAVMMNRTEAVNAIISVLSGAVLVGSNPGFDDRFLRKLLGPGSAQWHYRPYDIVQLAAAKIGAQAAGPLPWRSHILSRAVGVEPPTQDVAHTALGDARWARDVYDAVMTREKFPLSWEGRAQHAIGLYTATAIELEDVRRNLRVNEAAVQRACALHRKATDGDVCVHCAAFGPAYDNTWPCETIRALAGSSQPVMTGHHHYGRAWAGHAIEDACPCIKAPCGLVAQSVPECTQHRADKSTRQSHPAGACPGPDAPDVEDQGDGEETVAVPRTERERWVAIADALNAAEAAGMSVGIDLDGTLTDHNAWSVIWDADAKRWELAGYDVEDDDEDDQDDEESEETGDSDGDVLDLISEIAARLSDATDEGEYHAVNLIGDLANGRKTCDEARAELAEITFRHV